MTPHKANGGKLRNREGLTLSVSCYRPSFSLYNCISPDDLLHHAVQPVALEILDFAGVYQFGQGKTDEAAARYNLPVLAKMPLDPTLAELADAGEIENFQGHWLDAVAEKIIG